MATQSNFKVKNGLDVGNSLTVDSNATITGTLTLGGNTVDSSWVKARADSDYIKTAVDSAYVKTVQYGDNEELQFGAQPDLRIFHNGTHSFIRDVGTGQLRLTTNILHVTNGANNESQLVANAAGSVDLYYANAKKLETTAAGVTVTGTMNADSSTMTNLTLTGNLQVDGTQTIINSNTLTVNDKNIVLADSATNAAAADSGGITLNGANAKILYRSSGDKWEFNKAPYYNSARLITTDDKLIDSSLTTQLIDSAYIQARDRQRDSGFVTGLIDSAYVLARAPAQDFLDSAEAINLIDSAYVQARQTEGATRGFAIAMSIAL